MSESELDELRVFMRATKDTRLLQRAYIVWFSHLGKTVPEIAELLDVHPDTVREWIRRYEEEGLDGLKDDPRPGRPRKAGRLLEQTLLETVPKSPRLVGYVDARWTLQRLSDHLFDELGLRVSRETVRRLLLLNDIRFTRPKLHVESDDPEYEAKVERIQQAVLEASEDPNAVILFQDEADFHLTPILRRMWQRGSTRVLTPGVNRKLHVFGAYEPVSGAAFQRVCKRKRSQEFVAFLRQFEASLPRKRIVLVVDNFIIHMTKRTQAFLDRPGGRVELLFLPTYSPKLNPCEDWWGFEKPRIVANVFHETEEGLRKGIARWFRAYRAGRVNPFTVPAKAWRPTSSNSAGLS